MARYTGKNCTVNVGGNPIGSVIDLNINENAPTQTATALGDTYAQKDVDIIDASASLNVFEDPTDTSGQGALVIGSRLLFEVYPRGSTNTATPIRTFYAYVGTKTQQITRDFVRNSFELAIDGAIT